MVFGEQNMETSETMLSQCRKGFDVATAAEKVASNPLIMDRIFDFMDFKDLKNCRLVCPMWEGVNQKIFERQAKVVVSVNKRRPEKFAEDFKKSPLAIDDLEFHNSTTSFSLFVDVMQSKTSFLSSLTLNNVLILNENREPLREFDLTSLIGSNLTRLTINSSMSTQMIISQKNLVSVKFLDLHSVKLITRSDANRIAPWEIRMTNVSFYLETKNSNEWNHAVLCPPGFIDCRNVCVFDLKKKDGFIYSVTSKWDELNNPCGILHLANYNFRYELLTKTTPLAHLTHLTLKGHTFSFNWSYLPDTLETLFFDNIGTFSPATMPNPAPGFLPNLKVLKCVFLEDIPWIEHFSSHTTLIKVQLKRIGITNVFSLNWLPQSVKELHLDNINVQTNQEARFDGKLKSLTLFKYKLHKISPILKIFKTKYLSLMAKYPFSNNNLGEFFNILNLPVKSLAVGEFKWDSESHFRYSPLAYSVDKMSKYYIFKNGLGKAISDPSFSKNELFLEG